MGNKLLIVTLYVYLIFLNIIEFEVKYLNTLLLLVRHHPHPLFVVAVLVPGMLLLMLLFRMDGFGST